MLLRQYLERHLPLKPDEVHLSDDVRYTVLRGPYFAKGKITHVEAYRNLTDGSGHRLVVTRETEGGSRTFFGARGEPVYDAPMKHVAADMTLPKVLNRANRIEHKARQLEALVGGVAAAAALSAVFLGLSKCDGTDGHQAVGTAYEQLVDRPQALRPVEQVYAEAEQLQKVGGLVCALDGHEYEVGNR